MPPCVKYLNKLNEVVSFFCLPDKQLTETGPHCVILINALCLLLSYILIYQVN